MGQNTKPCGGKDLPLRATNKHEAVRRKGFTTKRHEGTRSLTAELCGAWLWEGIRQGAQTAHSTTIHTNGRWIKKRTSRRDDLVIESPHASKEQKRVAANASQAQYSLSLAIAATR